MARVCDLCGGVDDAPRHVVAFSGFGDDLAAEASDELFDKVLAAEGLSGGDRREAVRALNDRTVHVRHLDCCAAAGCPDGTCNAIHALTTGANVERGQELHAKDSVLRDTKLLDFIVSGAVDHVGAEKTQGV